MLEKTIAKIKRQQNSLALHVIRGCCHLGASVFGKSRTVVNKSRLAYVTAAQGLTDGLFQVALILEPPPRSLESQRVPH
jgi:hypothetical protein